MNFSMKPKNIFVPHFKLVCLNTTLTYAFTSYVYLHPIPQLHKSPNKSDSWNLIPTLKMYLTKTATIANYSYSSA